MTVARIGAAVILATASGAAAVPPVVDVLYSRAVGSPTANVPGAVDNAGNPVVAQFVSMLEFYVSPDGSKWLMRGATSQATTADHYLMLGSGASGSVFIQDGRPFPGAVGSEVTDFLSTPMYPFNSLNEWTYGLRARSGTASIFDKTLKFTAANVGSVNSKMGDLYTGMLDIPANPQGDEIVGNSNGSEFIMDDGRIGTHDTTIGNISTTRRPGLSYNLVKHLQNADTVTALGGVGTNTIQTLSSGGFWTSVDGSLTVVRGNIVKVGPPLNPAVMIVNGEVKMEVGQVIPGGTVTPSTFVDQYVTTNNDWYVRGADANGPWAAKNGVVFAKAGDAVGPDLWAGTPTTNFFFISANSHGDVLLAGKTNNANTAADDVLTLNGQVILREGDPVSLDLDGVPGNETAYIGNATVTTAAFTSGGGGIGADGVVYMLCNLRSTAAGGTNLAPSGTPYALLRITFPCAVDINGDGQRTVSDIFALLTEWFQHTARADWNHNGQWDVADIFAFLASWFIGC